MSARTPFGPPIRHAKVRAGSVNPICDKRHMVFIAKVIESLPSTIHPETPLRYVVAAAFAKALHADNAAFNAEKFLVACVATDTSDIPINTSTDSKKE